MDRSYFDWLLTLICYDNYQSYKIKYKRVLECLYAADFFPIFDRDYNRASDAKILRQTYCEIDPRMYDWAYEDISVLEMLIVLAKRMEQEYMFDDELGDRTAVWFWEMIDNLGMLQVGLSKRCMLSIIDNFLKRRYSYDGIGNIFYIPNCRQDLRSIEIWAQMMLYINEKFI